MEKPVLQQGNGTKLKQIENEIWNCVFVVNVNSCLLMQWVCCLKEKWISDKMLQGKTIYLIESS